MTDRFRRPAVWILAGLLLLAALVRFKSLAFGLPHTQTRPDETAVIDPVRVLLSGRFPAFFDYPWLFLFIVAIGYLGYFAWGLALGTFHSLGEMLASWPVHWEPFFLIPRAISATAGTLSVLLIARIGRQVRDDATGLVAALFLAVAFIHARDSHFGTTDVTLVFFVLAAITLLLDFHRRRDQRSAAIAGFVAGLATATKYNAAILIVSILVSCVLIALSAPGRRRRAILDSHLVTLGVAFAAGVAIGVPFIIFDGPRFAAAMRALFHSMAVGDPRLGLTNGWWHHLSFSLHYGIGLPLLITGLGGALALFILEPRTAALVLSFPIVYYAVAGSLSLLYFRYALPIVPFLCLTAAYGLTRGIEWLAARSMLPPPRRAAAVQAGIVLVAVALAWPSAVKIWAFDRLIGQTDNRLVLSSWFSDNVPVGSSVLQSGSLYGLAQLDRRQGYREWRWDRPSGQFLVNGRRPAPEARPDWIVVQESPLPSATQDVVKHFLKSDYALVAQFWAFRKRGGLVYDRLDMFYLPFNGFDQVERPGPNFSVYKRVA